MERFKKIGDMWEMGMVLDGIFFNYFYLSDYRPSIDIAYQRLEISKITNDNFGRSFSQIFLFRVYLELGEFKKAGEWANKSLKFTKANSLFFSSSMVNISMGVLYIEKKKCT